jgi:hypothetical protein
MATVLLSLVRRLRNRMCHRRALSSVGVEASLAKLASLLPQSAESWGMPALTPPAKDHLRRNARPRRPRRADLTHGLPLQPFDRRHGEPLGGRRKAFGYRAAVCLQRVW